MKWSRVTCMAAMAALAMPACNGGDETDAKSSDDYGEFLIFPVRNDDMAPKFPLIEESVLAFDPAAYDGSVPKVGDIVLFRAPRGARRMVLRVVAGQGQKIAFRKGRAIVDGERERKRRLLIESDCDTCTLPIAVRVPRDHLFLAGDHRSEAIDSRNFGPIPVRAVLGRVRHGLTVFVTALARSSS